MELDNLKNTWNDMGSQSNEKQPVNFAVFDNMSKKKFKQSLEKIILPELLGSAICIGAAVFIGVNFYKLHGISFQITAAAFILLCVLLPIISLLSIQHLYRSGDINKSYADTLQEFAVQKIQFCKLQKLNITLSYLLLVTVILLLTQLFGRNSVTASNYFFIWSFSVGYILLAFFSKWVFKSYNNTIRQTHELLHELAS